MSTETSVSGGSPGEVATSLHRGTKLAGGHS